MKSTLVDISGKLPAGMVELYSDLSEHAQSLDMKILVVGAMARDLILVHGYGATTERGTRDVDFAISVASWGEFDKLRGQLLAAGYTAHNKLHHNFEFHDSSNLPWEVDIVPFGDIADNHEISWPPEHDFRMSVLGFPEALASALQVQIRQSPDILISVASPTGICLLKLIAWTDRVIEKRGKDASDIKYLIETYSKIPAIFEDLFSGGYMEAQEWDETKASAVKLGEDTGKITTPEIVDVLRQKLFDHDYNRALFISDMLSGKYATDNNEAEEHFDLFVDALLSKSQ